MLYTGISKRCIHTGLIFRIVMCIHLFGTPVYIGIHNSLITKHNLLNFGGKTVHDTWHIALYCFLTISLLPECCLNYINWYICFWKKSFLVQHYICVLRNFQCFHMYNTQCSACSIFLFRIKMTGTFRYLFSVRENLVVGWLRCKHYFFIFLLDCKGRMEVLVFLKFLFR